uniref:Uncharacterized protein n=1 Tax=Setaria italica TaxID=4555 RepID=K3Y1E7_SETIT
IPESVPHTIPWPMGSPSYEIHRERSLLILDNDKKQHSTGQREEAQTRSRIWTEDSFLNWASKKFKVKARIWLLRDSHGSTRIPLDGRRPRISLPSFVVLYANEPPVAMLRYRADFMSIPEQKIYNDTLSRIDKSR